MNSCSLVGPLKYKILAAFLLHAMPVFVSENADAYEITCGSSDWVIVNVQIPDSVKVDMSLGTFVNANKGWFITPYPGDVWHTTDGGYTWQLQRHVDHVWLWNLDFADTLHGWIVGRKVGDQVQFLWHTTDGGKTWEETYPTHFITVTFLNSSKGFAGSHDSIYETNEGGKSWQAVTVDSGVHFSLNDIFFVDEQYGWAVGGNAELTDAGIILSTADSGATWQVQLYDPPDLNVVHFSSQQHGCAVGYNAFGGHILVTDDSGQTWPIYHWWAEWLKDVYFVNDSTGWITGDNGLLLHTTNGGVTWEETEVGVEADLGHIVFVENGKVGYIFGDDNTLLRYECPTAIEDRRNPIRDRRITPTLLQNNPNPFVLTTTIKFAISKESHVSLEIYDASGGLIKALVYEKRKAGYHSMVWNSRDIPSGIYFLRLKVEDHTEVKKLILVQ